VLLATKPEAWRADSCASLVDDCTRDGDHWGSLLTAIFIGAAQLKAGHDDEAADRLRRAAAAAQALDARALEAWTAALAAIASARLRRPDTSTQLKQAENLIDSAAVTGAYPLLDHARQLLEAEPAQLTHTVRLRCLGGFELEIDGKPVDWPPLRPRSRALLLLLAIHHGRDVHRERLIDTLWPEAPTGAGTHRLHVAASTVRQCLASLGLEQAVQRQGDAYRLALPLAWFDLAEFDKRLRRAHRSGSLSDWSSVLDLYVGELLPEVGPAEWVLPERERLRLAAADAAVQVASLASDAEALRAAHRAVELDPLRDSSWSLLAGLQYDQGDPTAAAATRREHARVCAELAAPISRQIRPVPDTSRMQA
jgi:DNA-binding SARP family transcriptional activator